MGNAICPVEHNSVCANTKTRRSDGTEAFDGAVKLMATFVQNVPQYQREYNPTYWPHDDATPFGDVYGGADPAYFE